MSQLEKEIEKYFVQEVKKMGGIALKLIILGLRGFPDRTILLPGGVVKFVELKRPKGGKASPHQIKWKKILTALGFDAQFLKNKDEVDDWITDLPTVDRR